MFKSIEIIQNGITEDEARIFIEIMTKIQNNLKKQSI